MSSRFELLKWINDTIDGHYYKVEQLSDGIGYMQVLNKMFPATVNLSGLKECLTPNDNYRNLKVLEDTMKSLKIKKEFDIEKLCRGKFIDNFDFLQWIHQYYNTSPHENGKPTLNAKKPIIAKPLVDILKSNSVVTSTLQPSISTFDTEHANKISDIGSHGIVETVSACEFAIAKRIEKRRALSEELSALKEDRDYYIDKLDFIHRMTEGYEQTVLRAGINSDSVIYELIDQIKFAISEVPNDLNEVPDEVN